MFNDPHVGRLAKLMDVANLRGRIIAGNLANQNTPGFRARAVSFEEAFQEALSSGKEVGDIEAEVYEPRNTGMDVDGNDVNVDKEVLAAAQNAFLYDAYASMIRGRNKLLDTALTSAP